MSDWANITAEGKDLTFRMLERNPRLRISAKEALDHPWFTLEQTGHSKLSMAEENMLKYCNGGRFNVEKIKPVFGCVSVFAGNDSSDSPASSGSSPDWDSSENADLSQPCNKLKLMFNNEEGISKEIELFPRHVNDEIANFHENEISEVSEIGESISNNVSSPLNKSFVPSVFLAKHWSPKPKPRLQSIKEISSTIKPRRSFGYKQDHLQLQPFKIQKKEPLNDSSLAKEEALDNLAPIGETSYGILKSVLEVFSPLRKITM